MAELDVKTYDDESIFGETCPSLELLDPIKGGKVDLQPGKVHVVWFFVTFYKGAYIVHEELSRLSENYAKDATFICVSADAEKEKAEKYLQKIAEGKVYDENTKAVLRCDAPFIAWDANKATGKMFQQIANQGVLHVPQAFIVGKDGKIVWRQSLTQSHTIAQTNFEQQLIRAIAGEPMELKEGPKPKPKVEEGEDAGDMADDMSLF